MNQNSKPLWQLSVESRIARRQEPSRASRLSSGALVHRLQNKISSLNDELFQLDTIKGLAVSLHDKIVKRIDIITTMFRFYFIYIQNINILFGTILCALCFVLVIIMNVHHTTTRLLSYTKC